MIKPRPRSRGTGDRWLARLAPLCILAMLCGCAPRKPNVLLITLDTTRADRLGCYGYTNAVTPALDKLAAGGARFANAQTVVPITLPAHATMLTGLLPPEHGLRINLKRSLPDDVPTVTESFKAEGYRTGAVIAFSVLDARYGLAKGFDSYDSPVLDPDDEKLMRSPPVLMDDDATCPYRRADEVIDRAIAWLKQGSARKPWFLWVHLYDPHYPWHWNRKSVGRRFVHPYDAEIAFMDQHLGRLLDHLDASGQASDTLVAAVGDHGEALGEHGEPAHSLFVYQATMHVPLLFRLPGRIDAGQSIEPPVSLVQLAPTLLDLAGVPAAPPLQKLWDDLKQLPARPSGASRADTLARKTRKTFSFPENGADPGSYLESDYGMVNYRWAPLRGIRQGSWKYIRAPIPELYNLAADPGELSNLAASPESNRIASLERDLAELEDLMTRRTGEKITLNRDELRIMASMGYLAGGQTEETNNVMSLPDPKLVNHASVLSARIVQKEERGDYGDETLAIAREVVAISPGTPRFHTQLARILDRRGQHAEALAAWEQALTLDAAKAGSWNGKAYTLVKLNREPEALPCFREAYRLDPEQTEGRQNLIRALNNVARMAANARQFKIADQLIDEGAALEPDNPGWNLSRVGVRLAAGERDAAIAILRKTLEENPHYRPAADALKQLGVPPR